MRYFKMEKRFLFCLLFLFLAINVSASESIPAPPQEQPIALINAVIRFQPQALRAGLFYSIKD